MYVTSSRSTSIYTGIENTSYKNAVSNTNVSNDSSGTKKFDFTQISRGDLLQSVNSLIKSGEMSLDESSSLVLLMGPKLNINGEISQNTSSNEIINVFDELNKSIAFNQSIGNDAGTLYDIKALNALMHLQGKTSSIDLKV